MAVRTLIYRSSQREEADKWVENWGKIANVSDRKTTYDVPTDTLTTTITVKSQPTTDRYGFSDPIFPLTSTNDIRGRAR